MIKCALFFIFISVASHVNSNIIVSFENRSFIDEEKEDAEMRNAFNMDFEYKYDLNEFLSLDAKVQAVVDEVDENRRYFDIRKAKLDYIHSNGDVRVTFGVDQISWGSLEVFDVVDTINQIDYLDGEDGAKYGQPVLGFAYSGSGYEIELYTIFGFRERKFPSEKGRIKSLVPIKDGGRSIFSDKNSSDVDLAVRYDAQVNSYLDIGLSYFNGTSREPYFDFNYDINHPKLLTVYSELEQYAFDSEFIYSNFSIKSEIAYRKDNFFNYWVSSLGFEYNFINFAESGMDVSFYAEYLNDTRRESSPNIFDDDLGLAFRLALNDTYDTTIQGSSIFDINSNEAIFTIEGQSTLNEKVQLNYMLRLFEGTNEPNYETTLLGLGNDLIENPMFVNDIEFENILNLVNQVVNNNSIDGLDCLLNLVQCFDRVNNDDAAINTLQTLQRNSNYESKLNYLEYEDFLRFELRYYF